MSKKNASRKSSAVTQPELVTVDLQIPEDIRNWSENRARQLGISFNDFLVGVVEKRRTEQQCETEVSDEVEVMRFCTDAENEVMTRKGNDYFVNGRKKSIQGAFRWFVKLDYHGSGGSNNIREQYRFLSAVARKLEGGAK